MIQALLGQNMAAPGTTGSNATTPYGQGFITGNMMNPMANQNQFGMQNHAANNPSTGLNSSNSLTTGPSTQMMQPYSTY